MDESLVLLRRKNCWDLDNILYHALKVKTTTADPILPAFEQRVNQVNYGDWMLYDHFNKTLWREIAKEEGFHEEVAEFKRQNALLSESCKGWAHWGEDKHRRALLEEPGLSPEERRCHLAMLDSVGFSRVFKYRQGVEVKECRTQMFRTEIAHVNGFGPGSEAIASAFIGAGYSNAINVAVPKAGYSYDFVDGLDRENMLVHKSSTKTKVNTLAAGRFRFNKERLNQIVVTSAKQRFKFGMPIWNPVEHFVWCWETLNVESLLRQGGDGGAVSMAAFLNAPETYLPALPADVRAALQNGQSYELGLVEAASTCTAEGLEPFVKDVNSMLKLGLNMIFPEMLAESLVLARRSLCWAFDDVVVVMTAAELAEQDRLATASNALPTATRDLILEFNGYDAKLHALTITSFTNDCKSQTGFAAEAAKLASAMHANQEACANSEPTSEAALSALVRSGRQDRCTTRLARTKSWIDALRKSPRAVAVAG